MKRRHHEAISTTVSTLPFLMAAASLALLEIRSLIGQAISKERMASGQRTGVMLTRGSSSACRLRP